MHTHTQSEIDTETVTCRPFSLFIRTYKLTTANTEFANTQPLLPAGNTGLGPCESLLTTFLCADQYTTLVCTEPPASHAITQACAKLTQHRSSARHMAALLSTGQPFSSVPGGHFTGAITSRKHGVVSSVASAPLQRGQLFTA